MEEVEFQSSRLFRTLGNPLRYRILQSLAKASSSPQELAEEFGKAQSNISQHLRILRDADLVWFRSEGKNAVYEIKAPEVSDLLRAGETLAARRHLGPRKKGTPPTRGIE
jgi:DNA-binding transcriptional ArsR family regulator